VKQGRNRHIRTLLKTLPLVVTFAVVLLFSVVLIAGCGEGVAEKAIEEAAEQTGDNVDVDINTDEGSVSISGENGDVTWQVGENVSIPEGFPTELIPEGAKVLSAVTSTESGSESQMVVFETSSDDKEIYDYYLSALPEAGYEITNKVRMESGDQGNAIAVQGDGPDGTIVVSGGGMVEDMYSYTIMVQP
jgi:hypothetical protein